jgi:DNA-binding CsgD family transcriptional regulator
MSPLVTAKSSKLPETAFAAALLNVAGSRSLPDLGAAFHQEIGRLVGSRSIGLYAIEDKRPRLLFSRQAAEGFLQEYDASSERDIIVDRLCEHRRAVDGFTLLGPVLWRQSGSFDLLTRWGYHHCMAGPLCVDGQVIGLVYTADLGTPEPYGASLLERMDVLCQAGSIALANMLAAGLDLRSPCVQTDCADAAACAVASSVAPCGVQLPRRSREVADLVSQGRSNKEIARELGLSVHTVKEYVGNLCRRLGVQNRTELAHRLFELR